MIRVNLKWLALFLHRKVMRLSDILNEEETIKQQAEVIKLLQTKLGMTNSESE